MRAKVRFLVAGGLTLLVAAVVLFQHQPSSAVTYSGYGVTTNGPLTLEVSVVPPVAQPGDQMNLTARLTTSGVTSQTPTVTLRLPQGVEADVYDLPAGATVNLQEGTLTWAPTVGPNTPSRELS
ncbi:MAG: hypothetical protein R3C44_05385 [Chloroflexota bacterium]